MFIKAIMENFKSFSEPTELTMISSSKIQSLNSHKLKIGGTNILKHAVIYGANAAGKSNLIDFFSFFQKTVSGSLPPESTKWFCKCNEENINKDSSFEIQFTIDGKFYAYGFTAILKQRKITSEWLYELYQAGTSKCLFERNLGEIRPNLGEKVSLTKAEQSKFDTYVEDFEGNESILFLTEMNRNKKYADDSKLNFFQSVYQWISENIVIISPDKRLPTFQYYYDRNTLDNISNIIETFDTGIENISIEEIDLEEFRNSLPREAFDYVMADIHDKMSNNVINKSTKFSMRFRNCFFTMSFDTEEPTIYTIKFHHKKSFYDFNLNEESDGTVRIFDLLDMLLNKEEDIVYVVDELDRSLHPKLTEHFLYLFMQLHEEHKNQLLFTTHESSIMDQKLFRRDEIWFVERNSCNSSSIYSLDQFKQRYDKDLGKAYLDGRYGAIPVFSSFNSKED